jgi:predicted Zn-dependent protease with MMP-like domain
MRRQTIGNHTVIFVLLNNTPGFPYTLQQWQEHIEKSNSFMKLYTEYSYGSLNFKSLYVGGYDRNGGTYNDISTEVVTRLINQGKLTLNDNIVFIYVFPNSTIIEQSVTMLSEITVNGRPYRTSIIHLYLKDIERHNLNDTKYVNYDNFVITHELGHYLGLSHAMAFDCSIHPIYGNCTVIEYGDTFDSMGSGFYEGADGVPHFNLMHKELLGWMPKEDILEIISTGTYTIRPLEYSSGIRGAKIIDPKTKLPVYYLEFRQPIGYDEYFLYPDFKNNTQGLIIHKPIYTSYQLYYPNYQNFEVNQPISILLDMNFDRNLIWVTLNKNMQYIDNRTGITIKTLEVTPNNITFSVTMSSYCPITAS